MYDLAGADPEVRFSPYCWRVKMACAHKGLPLETIPWRFSDKSAIAFSGQGLVPVLKDGDRVVHDSWAIADYLDATYPDRPALMANEQARALASLVHHYAQNVLSNGIFKGIVMDLFAALAPGDKGYFRDSREKRLNSKLEDFGLAPEAARAQLAIALSPLRALLKEQPFVNGGAPAWADYCLFGGFMWARNVSDVELLNADDTVFAWRERMLDLFDGLARKSIRAKG
jgi:glutathione S-transferase